MKAFQRHYACPECGPFAVFHSNSTNRNRHCKDCGSDIKEISEAESDELEFKFRAYKSPAS
jgi:uncharacterized protein (DUF983 family)